MEIFNIEVIDGRLKVTFGVDKEEFVLWLSASSAKQIAEYYRLYRRKLK